MRPRRHARVSSRIATSCGAALAAVVALAATSGCAAPSAPPAAAPRLAHVVLCWLREPGDADARARIVAATKALASQPGIVDVVVGPPLPSDRDVVDDSFDVGIVMRFATADDLERYLADPDHRRAVAEVLQPLCARVVVHDVRSE